jgi:hypothetical protein
MIILVIKNLRPLIENYSLQIYLQNIVAYYSKHATSDLKYGFCFYQ